MFKRSLVGARYCAALLILVAPALCQSSQSALPKMTPLILAAVLPDYPPIAAAAHITGKVAVWVTIQNGRVTSTRAEPVSLAVARYLQPATLLNIKTWRFGADVNDTFRVTYTYEVAGERSDGPTNPRVEMLPSLDVKITARPAKLYCSDGCNPE